MKISKKELNFLNQLTTEIIILDKEYKIIWLNDSALNKGWIIDTNKEKNLMAIYYSRCDCYYAYRDSAFHGISVTTDHYFLHAS